MDRHDSFFVAFPGALSAAERDACDRAGFRRYADGVAHPTPFGQDAGPPDELRGDQVLRVPATSAESARRMVVDVLGREPDGLRTAPGR